MTFDPPFYAVSSLAGIERSGSPILAATACLGVAPTEADRRRSLQRGRADYSKAD